MNNSDTYRASNYAAAPVELEPVNFIRDIYEPYADCIYGLVSKILHNTTKVEETFSEVINYISGQVNEYNPRRYSVMNWVMNTTRVITLKNFHSLRHHNVDYTGFTNVQLIESAVTEMHDVDGLSDIITSDTLGLPLAYVQFLLNKSCKNKSLQT